MKKKISWDNLEVARPVIRLKIIKNQSEKNTLPITITIVIFTVLTLALGIIPLELARLQSSSNDLCVRSVRNRILIEYK
jgi:hypothetical protein